MRALLIGVGGAGCRIVETLNLHDARSGVNSVRSYVFDSDREFINSISEIDSDHKIVLTPVDPIKNVNDKGTDFDVSHIVDCFQDYQIDNIDAVFVCAGLGGRMAEAVPSVLKQLKEAFPDPVFTILTLPGRKEGVKISSRASETLADIRRFASASIIFDNETWTQRIESGSINMTGLIKTQSIEENYPMLNEILSRQISLLFRAGEFSDEGVDSAEVVLDAGEVLNTLTGMDLVAIGFALEKLPSSWSGFMKKFRLEKYMLEEGHLKTSRIVDLAKKAVYEEVSVPCDLTSANKALVLISGPSEELSMKGFQTVRKWIDRSIRGLEMRAGDYPVKSTKYVGVIIVLAGIENVPRITELDEIKQVYEEEQKKVYKGNDISEIDVPRIPLLDVAKDEVIFEKNHVAPMRPLAGIDVAPHEYFEDKKMSNAGTNDDDIFEGEKFEEQDDSDDLFGFDEIKTEAPAEKQNYSDDPDDFFEVDEIPIIKSAPAQTADDNSDFFEEEPVKNYSRPVQRPAQSYTTGSIFDEAPSAPRYNNDNFYADDAVHVDKTNPQPKKYQKINVGVSKKLEKSDTKIQLPKRDKKEDGVLVGMANIGGNDKPKDTIGINLTNVGERKRPKETESSVLDGYISAGNSKRPKDSESRLSIGGTMRPKETDGHIRMSGVQRPKETDGIVRVSGGQRPKETDGAIKVGEFKRPKETDSGIPIEGAKKPKEVNRPIRVTSIPLPKNLEGKTVEKKR
ncbi:MAG: tubulin/FtsZ family protein [Methanocorpusculum sp.]|nr:tubulin/FtsZ family protein [Methanocorpusculum sp.]